jgi:hypothetical protein
MEDGPCYLILRVFDSSSLSSSSSAFPQIIEYEEEDDNEEDCVRAYIYSNAFATASASF